ncbi:allantoicase-like [Anopheles arabiensis]|uniref:allantoicase-like n=1 Tax=Anopheles arabiensis TaxID=7173 RepID=UPI001AAD8028|nr:allantoicase-like [Anopheles arabiensis]
MDTTTTTTTHTEQTQELVEPPPPTPPPAFTELSEVASIGSNGSILFATDDWFAPAEWMLKDTEPVFLADRYTAYGKWMDGWETRRKRTPGHDWCLVELGAPTQIAGVMIDTAFFTGNYVPRVSIQAGTLDATMKRMLQTSIPRVTDEGGNIGTGRTTEELGMVELIGTDQWDVLVPRTELQAGYEPTRRHYFTVAKGKQSLIVNHLRVNMFPDGGIARLRVYGTVRLNLRESLSVRQPFDMIAMLNGGRCTGFSNAHYGHPRNLIKPSTAVNMGDGWETARRLDRPPVLQIDDAGILQVPGCEWAIFQLGGAPEGGWIERICIDTKHFKGNFPDNVQVEYAWKGEPNSWMLLMEKKKLGPDRVHEFEGDELLLPQAKPASLVRITIAPDGGLSRVRVFGTVAVAK